MSAKTYKLLLHREAAREIRALPKKIRGLVESVLDGLPSDPRPPQSERLKGRRGSYRIRVGNYRIVYEVHATEIIVYVIGVAHRKEVYTRLLRRK
ncbi:MAG: mRNA interferase RelE/StbE [Hyphomicrobiaceae bacterium]|jgi:mRNA interferase RelE/StbE